MKVLLPLLRKELTDSLRDRRTLAMMLLLPALLYPGTMLLVGTVMAAGKARLATEELTIAVASDDAEQFLRSQPTPAHTTWKRMSRAEGENALKDKQVWAVVDAPRGSFDGVKLGEQAEVTVLYTKRHDRSMEALERIRKVLEAEAKNALKVRLVAAALPEQFADPVRIEPLDIDFQKDLGPLIASRMLPIILVMMLFMGALYPAIDVTAGEKERGTLETLLVAPVRPIEVMAAKYLTVAVIASLATCANLAAMAGTFAFGLKLDGGLTTSLHFSFGQVLTMLACLIPAAFMVSGVTLAIASLARNFKEAQSLLTPVTMVGILPGMLALMPGVELNALTAAVPLLNVALMVKAVVLGAAHPLHVAITVVSILTCSLGALKLAANAFASEALRFGGTESWRALFRGNS
ncbi:MAG: Abortive infection protein [Myxococcaceae bacterium]|nr:Abortive infection protein [Myxococcaceae bacterium]